MISANRLSLAALSALWLMTDSGFAQDTRLPATYQTLEGFRPGPEGSIIIAMQAGGRVDARHLGEACASWITAAPDVRLRHAASSFPLRIATQSAQPVVLLLNHPDGSWACSRSTANDRGEHRAELTAPPYRSGTYDIWVGTVTPPLVDTRLILDEPVTPGP